MARKGAAMASFHLAVKAISRGAGRSATAAAANRAGVEIEDERTGLVHDYTRKQGVEHQEIVAPDDAPSWVHDRAALWNAAEAAERRKDAKVAREYEIALPAELDAAQRRELALGFAREISDRYGVAVDVAIHLPGREGDHRNHHAHLLATTRRISPEGMGAKTRELDVKATASVEVEQLRERWAEMQNQALEHAGHIERVDHRSLKAQGIEAEPELKQGPAVTAMERMAKQIAQRQDQEYQPVTKVGRHNAEVHERRGLRQYIERGGEWLREHGAQMRDKFHELASTLNRALGVDQQQERDRQRAVEREQERHREIEQPRVRQRDRDRGWSL
jgi:ATP-dependent exoDNAse (exonuclease V) alpha subunit